MPPFFDDFSNQDLARFYDILPGVGNLVRRSDGLHYAILRGPDGPASAETLFTIDSLGRPQPPTAKAVLEFRGSQWSLEAVVDYDFEQKTNGRSAQLSIAFGEPTQAHQHGIALVRSADLDAKSHVLVACVYNTPAEPHCAELTRTPRSRNWFRIKRSDSDFEVEWSEDGVGFTTVLKYQQPSTHLSQFVILNSSCPYRKLSQPMANKVRHLRAVMYKINLRWRVFSGETLTFRNVRLLREFQENRSNVASFRQPSECKDDGGRRLAEFRSPCQERAAGPVG